MTKLALIVTQKTNSFKGTCSLSHQILYRFPLVLMRVPFLKRISMRWLKSSSFYFVGSSKRIDQEIEESYKREQWNTGK